MTGEARTKVMFVGLGSIGQRHLRNLRTIMKGEVEIFAVRKTRDSVVLDEQLTVVSREDVADYYGIQSFDELDQGFAVAPHIVFVTNPSAFHAEVAYQAVQRGCHVFIEKPIASSWTHVGDLIALARQNKCVVAVGYQFRFHPGLKLVKQWLAGDRIGRVISAEFVNAEYIGDWHKYEDYRGGYAARRDLGGGALLTQSHEFDLVCWLLGRPRRVFAVGGHLSGLEVDVEDSVSVLMDIVFGARSVPVTVHLDYLQSPPVRRFVIVGEQGRIVWDDRLNLLTLIPAGGGGTLEKRYADFKRNDMFMAEMRDFLEAVQKGTDPEVSMEQGCGALAVSLAARRSMEEGTVVCLSDGLQSIQVERDARD